MEQQRFDRFFAGAPVGLSVEAIRREWLALAPRYSPARRALPLPLWARRGLSDNGEQAWQSLQGSVPELNPAQPLCIYIHIPFCAHRCAFCDCYSYPLRQHRATHAGGYVALLEEEIRIWSSLGNLAGRPVSTVHLGGGTPTFLDAELLKRLTLCLREHFSTGPGTEWALESTTSEFSEPMMAALHALGFSRLHLGVQSLDDAVRRRIGRREAASAVLAKIAAAVRTAWVVSVDLIAGLPGQSLTGLLAGIRALAAAGVDGFSLYELQLSPRNMAFARRCGLAGRDSTANYWLFQAAAQQLAALGYRKTLFNHWARERDTNLYFTFPERGEDCLAIGTIADGVLGDYHYRHPELKAYRHSVSKDFPGLQGGLRRTERENRMRRMETALLSGSISSGLLAGELGPVHAARLLSAWRAASLVERDSAQPSRWRLTGNGSWLAGTMLEEVREATGKN